MHTLKFNSKLKCYILDDRYFSALYPCLISMDPKNGTSLTSTQYIWKLPPGYYDPKRKRQYQITISGITRSHQIDSNYYLVLLECGRKSHPPPGINPIEVLAYRDVGSGSAEISSLIDCVYTMPAHFENGEKCDGKVPSHI